MEAAHERTYRQLVRRLQQPNPRPGLTWIACADLSLREEIEARLCSDLAISNLSVLTWNTHPAAPWDEILAAWEGGANERRPVVVHYDAIEPPQIDLSRFDAAPLPETPSGRALLQLNVGRDLGVRRGAVVLLWVCGLGPLEVVQSGAPDLWAHRLLVCRFPSAADFPIHEGADLGEQSKAIEHIQIDSLIGEADSPWITDRQRFVTLSKIVYHLVNTGNNEEAVRRLEQLRELYHRSSIEDDEILSDILLERELLVSAALHDIDRIKSLVLPEQRSLHVGSAFRRMTIARSLGNLHQAQGDTAERLSQLDHEVADAHYVVQAAHPDVLAAASALIQRAWCFFDLALPLRALSDAREAERGIEAAKDVPLSHRHGMQGALEILLARVSQSLGLVEDALEWGWRALHRLVALGAWARIRPAIDGLAALYVEVGLPGIARALLLNELEVLSSEEDTGEVQRELHQRLAEIGLLIGNTALILDHGPSAVERPGSSSSISNSLDCQQLVTRAQLARMLRPQLAGFRVLEARVDDLVTTLGAPEIPPFHRDALRLELARWRLMTGPIEEAALLVTESLAYRTAQLGPAKVIEAQILASEIEHRRGDLKRARTHLDATLDILTAQPEQAQPFSIWRNFQRQRAALARAEGRREDGWAAFDILLEIADRRRLVLDGIDLRLEQAETNLGHPRAQDNADTCLTQALELGYMRLEGRARLLLAELAWQRNDHDTAARELETATWLVDQLGPIDAQQRARVLKEKLSPEPTQQ